MGVMKIPNNAAVFQAAMNSNSISWQGGTPYVAGMTLGGSSIGQGLGSMNSIVLYGDNGYVGAWNVTNYNSGRGISPVISRALICRNAIPTQAEIDAYTNTYYSAAAIPRLADVILEYTFPNTNNPVVGNVLTMPMSPTVAKISATATWFMVLTSTNVNWAGGGSGAGGWATITQAIVGTVSDTAGNGDLKLVTTNLVANSLYKLPAISIPLPTKFSW